MLKNWLNYQNRNSQYTFTVIDVSEKQRPDDSIKKYLIKEIIDSYRNLEYLKFLFKNEPKDKFKKYLEDNVFPSTDGISKNVWQGDFGEILASLIVSYFQGLLVPLKKLRLKFNKDKSIFATDLFAHNLGKKITDIYYYEVKTRLNINKKESIGDINEYVTIHAHNSLLKSELSSLNSITDMLSKSFFEKDDFDNALIYGDITKNPTNYNQHFELFFITEKSSYLEAILENLNSLPPNLHPLNVTVVLIGNLKDLINSLRINVLDMATDVIFREDKKTLVEKETFFKTIEDEIDSVINDYLFNHYKKQLIAWKLSKQFNRTYNESYLWNKLLYISNNACVLLAESRNRKLAMKALYVSAEVYEYLSDIGENYDRLYCLILSALCYDLAGYQANACCLLKKLPLEYSFESIDDKIDIKYDNYILHHVQKILLKNIFIARQNIDTKLNIDSGIMLFNNAIDDWYKNILNGEEADYTKKMNEAYKYYLDYSNQPISHLLFLFKTRLQMYSERSIWKNLSENIKDNSIWKKYIKLLVYDLYENDKIKDVDKRISKFELWTSQLRAIEKGILKENKNYVIQMPTSTGKTFIAEISILDHLVKYPNKKCIYVAPFRALTSEKENELSQNLSKLGYSVSSLSGSYEIDEFQEIILNESDVLIATPEKIDLLFRINPEYFNHVSLIVIDEGHIIGDISTRASLVEFLVIRLKIKVESIRILFISAVMPDINADEYSFWLNGKKDYVVRSLLYPDSLSDEQWEPTRKLIGKFVWKKEKGQINFVNVQMEDENTKQPKEVFISAIIETKKYGKIEFPKKNNKADIAVSLGFKFSITGNTLIFCAQVRYTKSVGESFLKLLRLLNPAEIPEYLLENTKKESYFYSKIWFGDDSYITQCIKHGIGIHFGDMPEQVRNSVESDFRKDKLRILISTNTIGQGLNFPIKHLIFHSTLIAKNYKIKNRDFWNIVGRAGRAGKETEGQIIFLINSPTDEKLFKQYIKKEQIEPANSLFFNIIGAFLKRRINKEQYDNYFRILSEPYLFDLLVEETVEIEEIVEKIIQNSLFKIQVDEVCLKILKNSFLVSLQQLKNELTPQKARLYGKTGFSLKSNKIISEFIEFKKEYLQTIIQDDNYLELIKLIFELFDKNIEEIKLGKLQRNHFDYLKITQLWISGADIQTIRKEWKTLDDDPDNLFVLISQGFYYKYSWGITSFLTILSDFFNIEMNSLPINIRNLTSYVKFGLNIPNACLARMMGIKSRDVAVLLSNKFGKKNDFKNFISWLCNLTKEDIHSLGLFLYEEQNILDVALRLSLGKKEDILDYNFCVKGIQFEELRKHASLKVNIGDVLNLVRDCTNAFDPYAVKILKNQEEIGYIPREFSKKISIEIDINEMKFQAIVTDIQTKNCYNDIFCKIQIVS